MDIFSILPIIFVVFGLLSALNKGMERMGRPRGPVLTAPKPELDPEWPNQVITPQYEERTTGRLRDQISRAKEIELARAVGHEGAWGDEGRYNPAESGENESPVSTGIPIGSIDQTVQNQQANVASAQNEWLNMRTENLVHAVIWSEILGKPRALRRYSVKGS